MECMDCGNALGQNDLIAVSCQGCGEALMPEDIEKLEAKLGIVKEIPEIETPVLIPEGGIKIPEVLDCKNDECGMPLYGSEIEEYLKGVPCQYCQKSAPGQSAPIVVPTPEPEPLPQEPVESSTKEGSQPVTEPFTGKTLRTRFCTGPLAGTEFDLPVDTIIGRKEFNDIITSESKAKGTDLNWYSKSISRISREHFKLTEDGTITDMGSNNGTILDREEIFGEGGKFGLGNVLNIADELMLTRVASRGMAMHITHVETNITIDISVGGKIHLGRLREDGRREPFTLAISDHMNRTDGMDADEIRRISRRHVILRLDYITGPEVSTPQLVIENIDGKKVRVNPTKRNPEPTELNSKNTKQWVSEPCSIVIGKSQYSISFIV
jgi:hypothetical protein